MYKQYSPPVPGKQTLAFLLGVASSLNSYHGFARLIKLENSANVSCSMYFESRTLFMTSNALSLVSAIRPGQLSDTLHLQVPRTKNRTSFKHHLRGVTGLDVSIQAFGRHHP
jgi:hypothetical protein